MTTKYKALDYKSGELILGKEEALTQASQTLDVAAEQAEKAGDRETLLQVAALWLNMSNLLGSGYEEEEPEYDEQPPGIGFANVVSHRIGEDEDGGTSEASD